MLLWETTQTVSGLVFDFRIGLGLEKIIIPWRFLFESLSSLYVAEQEHPRQATRTISAPGPGQDYERVELVTQFRSAKWLETHEQPDEDKTILV